MPDTPESVRDHLGNAALLLIAALNADAAMVFAGDCTSSEEWHDVITETRARLDRAEAALAKEEV